MALPPPPIGTPANSYAWQDWYIKLGEQVSSIQVTWAQLDKSGSSLSDIVTRPHSSLQSLQGGTPGEYYHLTSAQVTKVNGAAPLDSPAFTTSVGFNGASAMTKPTITGSRGGNAALASLLTQLANYGLITDSTTA